MWVGGPQKYGLSLPSLFHSGKPKQTALPQCTLPGCPDLMAIVKFKLYYSHMGRLTDRETIAIEKVGCYIPRSHGGVVERKHREAPGSVRRLGVGKSLHCGFCGKEHERQGNQAWDWLIWITLGLWGVGLSQAVWYLVLCH